MKTLEEVFKRLSDLYEFNKKIKEFNVIDRAGKGPENETRTTSRPTHPIEKDNR